MHLATIFHDDRLLQVGFERAVRRALGERAIMTEGGGFTTVCAFSHFLEASFLAIIPGNTGAIAPFCRCAASSRRHGILPYITTFLKVRCPAPAYRTNIET